MVLFSLLVIFCSYRFGCLIKDSIVSSCSHNFSFPHFSITCHFFSCVSILRVLASSYQNVVSIIPILHFFAGTNTICTGWTKNVHTTARYYEKMRAPVVRGKRKTSQFLRKHCCFLDWSSLGRRQTFVTCKTIHFPFGPRKYMKILIGYWTIWAEKKGLSCTLESALLVCKTFSSLGPKKLYVLMGIGTLWKTGLRCIFGMENCIFLGCVEPFNFHDLKF